MPNICLPKLERENIGRALKSGELSLTKLYEMTSTQRNTTFSSYVGENLASFVNAKFEQAMLSNQKKAIRNWVERITTSRDPIRRDMLKKVESIENILKPDEEVGFLKDLAELKIGIDVTEEEAGIILKLKKVIDEFKVKIPRDSPNRSQERLAYGYALDDFKNYVSGLKRRAETLTLKERIKPTNYFDNLVDIAAVSKSLVATLDNSFIGRQGIKTLLDGKYSIWATTVAQSFKNFGRELVAQRPKFFQKRSDAVMSSIRADIYSRPNALNGKYNAASNGYGLGVTTEEVFPSSFPERIPLLGRIFKASETAFNGSALRMRADLADALIASAEKSGVDMLDAKQATSFGKLVSSMTGRGELGKISAIGRELNVLMFSVRFLKSNFDTLTAHLLDKTMTPEAKRAAVLSTLRIAASITTILSISKMLDPDSVEFDPRGTKFGKIKAFDHTYDVTGGMSGLITLGSRVVPTFHNGEFGFWTKSSSTGKYTKMSQGVFGEQTALDTFENFFEGKLSPTFGMLRDIWKGQNFQGDKPNFVNSTLGLITPISAEIIVEELEKGNDDILLVMLAEAVGVSVSDTMFRGFGVKWGKLKEKVDTNTYNRALKDVTRRFNERADKLESSSRFKKMNNEDQTKELDKIRREETDRVLRRYGI